MRVRDRMTAHPRTIDYYQSIRDARDLMTETGCRRLPVMKDGKLVGLVTNIDLSRATPSNATTLSMHELNYLLARVDVHEALPPRQQLITIGPDDYVESAARLMREHSIGGLPVVENGALVGIITETDIFDAFIDILGVRSEHTRIDFYIKDHPGTVAEITGLFGRKNLNITNSVLFFDDRAQRYKLILRIAGGGCEEVLAELRAMGYQPESVFISGDTPARN
ncbi:MAG: CBS and ACT domain-containing protein [Syntrophomonadaceae bacterium]|nr:CBS and ACT domain-containing protein [Syntrophomonadaceae bacterium]